MLDPSSSEEESDEIVEEESSKEVLAPAASGARLSPSRTSESSGGGGGGSSGGLQPSSRSASSVRPSSPSPSVVSEKEKEELERLQKEEEERKKKLQLYVFVMRCIAYPFNAKQPTDMARRQQKVKSIGLSTEMELEQRLGGVCSRRMQQEPRKLEGHQGDTRLRFHGVVDSTSGRGGE
ncbi:hypothetical protein NXF25_004799 [Crotalus adamanteus]|uniref:Uncharacterized protein n=1 Tax=Crotalus adamanteus TaxID=8729 RepID=A0AAW1BV74_CROAD